MLVCWRDLPCLLLYLYLLVTSTEILRCLAVRFLLGSKPTPFEKAELACPLLAGCPVWSLETARHLPNVAYCTNSTVATAKTLTKRNPFLWGRITNNTCFCIVIIIVDGQKCSEVNTIIIKKEHHHLIRHLTVTKRQSRLASRTIVANRCNRTQQHFFTGG